MENPACKAAWLTLMAISFASCSSMSGLQQEPTVTDHDLLAADVFPPPSDEVPRSKSDAFAISPEMAHFLIGNVATYNDERTFNDLVDAMEAFGIRYLSYDNQTLTASQAFEQSRGNCLTFTNMFLVMARQVGLKARFQEVRIPPDWIMQGNMMVLRRHINVRVHLTGQALGGIGERVVDFGDESVPSSYIDTANRVISDERAMAHFYNNWAAETLENGNYNLAFAYLRKALQEGDPDFSPAWNLVGVMYQRVGREDLAEQAYLRALLAEPDATPAMSNLQRLYDRQGRSELAHRYDDLVARHRLKNPYFRLAEAHKAYAGGDYQGAIEQLRKAIRLKSDDSEFYFLLGDAYSGSGDLQKAAHYRAEGERVAAEEDRIGESGDHDQRRRLIKPKAPGR